MSTSSSSSASDTSDSSHFKILSYNIDGLNDCQDEVMERTFLIIALILSQNPDIIHLQEVIPRQFSTLLSSFNAQGYQCSEGDITQQRSLLLRPYFTLSFIKRNHPAIQKIAFERIAYEEKDKELKSFQGRDLLLLQCHINNYPFLLVNAHLESCGAAFKSPQSIIRQAQLKMGLQFLENFHKPEEESKKGEERREKFGFLMGDLNIRDSEATHILKGFSQTSKSHRLIDVAEEFLKKKTHLSEEKESHHNAFEKMTFKKKPKHPTPASTWIMPGKPEVSCRFDRCYYLGGHSEKSNLELLQFSLIGNEEVFDPLQSKSGYGTPSDHFGIVVEFTIKNGLKQPEEGEKNAIQKAFESNPQKDNQQVDNKINSGQDLIIEKDDQGEDRPLKRSKKTPEVIDLT